MISCKNRAVKGTKHNQYRVFLQISDVIRGQMPDLESDAKVENTSDQVVWSVLDPTAISNRQIQVATPIPAQSTSMPP